MSKDAPGSGNPSASHPGLSASFLSIHAVRVFVRDLERSLRLSLLACLVDEVRSFSPQEQHDDLTLIVARRRAAAGAAVS